MSSSLLCASRCTDMCRVAVRADTAQGTSQVSEGGGCPLAGPAVMVEGPTSCSVDRPVLWSAQLPERHGLCRHHLSSADRPALTVQAALEQQSARGCCSRDAAPLQGHSHGEQTGESAVAVADVWPPAYCEHCWLLGWTIPPLKHVLVLPTDTKPAAQHVLAQHSMLLDLTASHRRLVLACTEPTACAGSACRLPTE